MSDDTTYTIEESDGVWFQLWWRHDECIYSEELRAGSREQAEAEAARNAAQGSLERRVLAAFGYAAQSGS